MQCLIFCFVICILLVWGQISIMLSWLPCLWSSRHYFSTSLALLTRLTESLLMIRLIRYDIIPLMSGTYTKHFC